MNDQKAIANAKLRKLISEKGTIFVLLLMVLVSTILYGGNFFSWSNITNVLRQISWYGMAAIGVNLCILSGGRDVSAGYTAMLTGMVFAYCFSMLNLGVVLSLVISLMVGPAIGLLNGFIIAKLNVGAMIATLSTGWVFYACGLMMNGNWTITMKTTPALERFYWISRSSILWVPTPFLIFLAMVFGFWIFATRTSTGRAVYAVGGDPESAAMMGINVARTKMIVHLICSCLACVAGIFLVARTSIGDPASCGQWGFTLMSTVVIGGTRMRGGSGDVRGVIVGVLTYGLISNILSMGGLSMYWQNLITGLVLLTAILTQKRQS
ncbi:MAG: ABC transporter permease [Clostridiales bacterium]|nr:ABC transporter permease [Clostridiales bacterium]